MKLAVANTDIALPGKTGAFSTLRQSFWQSPRSHTRTHSKCYPEAVLVQDLLISSSKAYLCQACYTYSYLLVDRHVDFHEHASLIVSQ